MTSSSSSSAAEKMAEALLLRASVEVSFLNIITAANRDIDLVFGSSEPHQSCIDFLEYMINNLFSQSSREETNVVKDMRQEVEKLKLVSLPRVQQAAVSMDSLEKKATRHPPKNIQLLLSRLGELAFNAEDEFAGFKYKLLTREMLIRNQEKDNVGGGAGDFSSSEIFNKEFRGELLPRVKGILSLLKDINKKVEEGFPDISVAVSAVAAPVLPRVMSDHEKVNSSLTFNEQDAAASVPDLESHPQATLSTEHCWSIIKDKANMIGEADSTDLEEIGIQIAEKCQGLPLAANLLGGLLKGQGMQFCSSILESGVLDAENVVSQILRLIFESLPSPFIKKCFAFASILPRDSIMERLQIIQLWMAEGFLDPEIMAFETPEEVGDQYFDILLRFSLFQPVTMEKYSNKITHCKMHVTVHDFASSISISEIANGFSSVETAAHTPRIRHIAFESFAQEHLKKIVKENGEHLKTLFLRSDINYWFNFYRVQVLNLSGADIRVFPTSVELMVLLEYLDLSRTNITSLPDSVCRFHKLHTLRISHCNSFKGFPLNFKNLLNLRHIHNYCLNDFEMPMEIGRLTNLQTLTVYNVGKPTGIRIGELGSLKNLRNRLEIWNLDYVSDKKEAELADLFGKPHLQELLLHWPEREVRDDDEDVDALPDEDVLDGLQPNPNLKSLVIENFLGDRFPSWVMNMSVSAGGSHSRLNNLVEVKLKKCYRLREIPTLGLLPHLRDLEITGLDEVTLIGHSFYDEKVSGGSESASRTTNVYFPALKSLTLHTLKGLQHWMGIEETSASDGVRVFPELESLSVSHCSQLESAPSHFPSLKDLIINNVASSSLLVNIGINSTSLRNFHIQQGVGLICLPDGLLQNKPNLARLHIEDCQSLKHLVSSDMSGLNNLASVRELVIRNCGSLKELPAHLFESLQSLEKLEISKCPKLESLPTSFGQDGLTSLSSLVFCGCQISIRAGLEKFTSLRSLDIDGNSEWDSLPEQIQHLTALEHLTLRCFRIESLPDWMEKLFCLQELHLISCESLQSFPSRDTMRCLLKLRKLTTKECPLLFQRWTEQSNLDCEWFKVSHISTIFADEQEVSYPYFWKNFFGIRSVFDISSVEKKKKAKKKTSKKSKVTKSKPQSHIAKSSRI